MAGGLSEGSWPSLEGAVLSSSQRCAPIFSSHRRANNGLDHVVRVSNHMQNQINESHNSQRIFRRFQAVHVHSPWCHWFTIVSKYECELAAELVGLELGSSNPRNTGTFEGLWLAVSCARDTEARNARWTPGKRRKPSKDNQRVRNNLVVEVMTSSESLTALSKRFRQLGGWKWERFVFHDPRLA